MCEFQNFKIRSIIKFSIQHTNFFLPFPWKLVFYGQSKQCKLTWNKEKNKLLKKNSAIRLIRVSRFSFILRTLTSFYKNQINLIKFYYFYQAFRKRLWKLALFQAEHTSLSRQYSFIVMAALWRLKFIFFKIQSTVVRQSIVCMNNKQPEQRRSLSSDKSDCKGPEKGSRSTMTWIENKVNEQRAK